jgi:hypothetical protein
MTAPILRTTPLLEVVLSKIGGMWPTDGRPSRFSAVIMFENGQRPNRQAPDRKGHCAGFFNLRRWHRPMLDGVHISLK